MKKVLSFISMLIFVVGFTFAQNPPEKKSTTQTHNKVAKVDTTKKAHHMASRNSSMKKSNTMSTKKSTASPKKSGSK